MQRELSCPNCGHDLSMFEEPPMDRAESMAVRVADAVASWRFAGALLVVIVGWFTVNLAARPFAPFPIVMLAGLATILSTIAAFYGPLILLSQRRAALRDRARDVETYVVSANTEADLHALRGRLDVIDRKLDAGQR